MADLTITPHNDGPYHLKGKFTIVTDGGREIDVDGDETWLCRCGHSAEKPFCDGTHRKIGFQSNLDQPVAAAGEYVAAAGVDEIGEGEIKGIRVAGQPVVIGKVDGVVYAIGGVCTHRQALLEEGDLDGEVVLCPLHNSGFNIKTGQAIQLPAEVPVSTFDVRIEDGQILVATSPKQAVEA